MKLRRKPYPGPVLILIMSSIILAGAACSVNDKDPDDGSAALRGSYLGQKPPGSKPALFAPGIVSTMYHEHSAPSFSPDGETVFWVSYPIGNYNHTYTSRILFMSIQDGAWTEPEYAPFARGIDCGEAFFTYDGKTVFFSSNREITAEDGQKKKNRDIWLTRQTASGWSAPENVGIPVSTENLEAQPTVTDDLTLYYLGHLEGVKNNYGIFRSRYLDGNFSEPEVLPRPINHEDLDWTPFIARDESYLIWASFREEGYGSGDLYISFRSADDTWSEPVNLGPDINGPGNERYPAVSPDGKYLFFITDKLNPMLKENPDPGYQEILEIYNNPGNGWSDIYWVDAGIIRALRPVGSE